LPISIPSGVQEQEVIEEGDNIFDLYDLDNIEFYEQNFISTRSGESKNEVFACHAPINQNPVFTFGSESYCPPQTYKFHSQQNDFLDLPQVMDTQDEEKSDVHISPFIDPIPSFYDQNNYFFDYTLDLFK